ncbi:zinc ABC transporter substrate-binding lipoprotein AdcA [Staphylococcus intermedius]|uniref:Mn+2/Zn+2 ABC transporter periplasmic protein n=1 Tax=Staphylococcus intermedius NCTC 11048 TaxID=1141106 RepID=A0A380G3F3_STAIN|nr:zinc ABC transporter substrate-binding lipoprotein AdcA [Staphylococcus intermedius]PCF64013.1 zinc ABC transporter substrate-binding protein [Staphylococcus intermedius]PCF78728.1 zinc ABC transporter substrate-binding protein [Staphylococcus intermedius]PCF79701.1 zinc ABC transporter substrate-binding protein [Staphylococcus intermedius]PCF85949.1 zinc ABC transporter substrate-binding protein [Staphylococcus intermedius]PCF89640.1 zinc ABC transporter substrate-binding protein [Staphylo
MKKGLKVLAAVLLSGTVLAACGQDGDDKASKDQLKVTTTVFPLQSFVKQIGGEHVTVDSIYPKGTDLHSFEPTQKDIIDASQSDLFIYTGDDLDPVAKKVASAIKKDDHKLSLENSLDKATLLTDQHEHGEHEEHGDHDEHGEEAHEHGESHEEHEHHHHGGYDPHVWLDPQMDKKFVTAIRDDLSKRDPEHKAEYEKNADKVLKDLDSIDKELKDVTKDHQGHAVFISHESLGYLADRYGFVQKGVQSLNAEDPSQKELTEIVKEINDTGAKYILYEENVANKVTDTIRKETDAQPLKFNNMEAVSKDQEKDATYQSLMKENVKNIEKALNDKIKVEDDKAANKHSKAIQDGYFKDDQVKDRDLSDYAGEWQSVYPLLKDGTLDEVFEHKAEDKGDKSAKEYKAYYDKGYKTDVEKIKITDNQITFTKNGKSMTGTYSYDGKDILKYDGGNRGVRYTFKLEGDASEGLPKYVQFSDHNIAPTKTGHFHIFTGNDRDKVLKELENWPTYYPADLSKEEVKDEMLAH